LWGFEPVSPVFIFFFPVLCVCTLSTRAQTSTSHAPTLAGPEDEAAAPSRGLDDDDRLHPHRVHHPRMSHGFCARPVVGTRPTTLFDPQRDRRRRTASGMKPMYRLTVSPFFIFSFFFFPSPVRLRTLLTRIRTPSRVPPLSLDQKPKRPRRHKVLTTTMPPAPTSRASPTHVPPTISTHGRPPSSNHKETTSMELPVA